MSGQSGLLLCGNARPSTFGQCEEAIGASARENFALAVRPSNLDAIDLIAASQAKMEPHIVVRDVAGAAAYLLSQFMATCNNCNLGANSIAIRLCTSRDHA